VKLSKRDLRTRVKPFLPIEFTDEPLTSHAGLELFRRFAEQAGWIDRLRTLFADRRFDSDYGSFRTVVLVVGMLLLGGSRLSHVRVLDRDPLFLRLVRLRRLPDERTLSRGLQAITGPYREELNVLLRDVAYETSKEIRLSRATIELDGTVIRTGECVDGAERGFNPHHPKDPSYYPLTAHLAQTGQLLGVWNRSGNVNDSVGAAGHLAALLADVRRRLQGVPLEVRLDGAFIQRPVLEVLTASRVEYAVKVPMWKWLGVRQRIAARRSWKRVNGSVDGFSISAIASRPGAAPSGSSASASASPARPGRTSSSTSSAPTTGTTSTRWWRRTRRSVSRRSGLSCRSWRSREDARRTQAASRLRHRTDARLGRQQRVAAAFGAHSQPRPPFPGSDGCRSETQHPKANLPLSLPLAAHDALQLAPASRTHCASRRAHGPPHRCLGHQPPAHPRDRDQARGLSPGGALS